jgi:hypothetical protein
MELHLEEQLEAEAEALEVPEAGYSLCTTSVSGQQ